MKKADLSALLAFAASPDDPREGLNGLYVTPGEAWASNGVQAVCRVETNAGFEEPTFLPLEPLRVALKVLKKGRRLDLGPASLTVHQEDVRLFQIDFEPATGEFPIDKLRKLTGEGKGHSGTTVSEFAIDPVIFARLGNVKKAAGAPMTLRVPIEPHDPVRFAFGKSSITWFGAIMPMRLPWEIR